MVRVSFIELCHDRAECWSATLHNGYVVSYLHHYSTQVSDTCIILYLNEVQINKKHLMHWLIIKEKKWKAPVHNTIFCLLKKYEEHKFWCIFTKFIMQQNTFILRIRFIAALFHVIWFMVILEKMLKTCGTQENNEHITWCKVAHKTALWLLTYIIFGKCEGTAWVTNTWFPQSAALGW